MLHEDPQPRVVVTLTDEQGETLHRDADGVWVLQENRSAIVVAAHCAEHTVATWNGVELERIEAVLPSERWRLPNGLWAGAANVVLYGDDGTAHSVPVRVSADATKLQPSAWARLLAELDDWLSGVSVGAELAGHGGVSSRGASAPLVAEALIPLVPTIVRAVRRLDGSARLLETTHLEDVHLSRAPKVDSETLVWLSRHPVVAHWTRPWETGAHEGPEPLVPVRHSLDRVDHPVNCWLRWALERAARTLKHVAQVLGSGDARDASWSKERAARAGSAAEELEHTVRHTFLRNVSARPADDAASLVLIDDPRYAHLAALLRPFLSPRYAVDATRPVGLKPTYDLYELWCFLAVARQVKHAAMAGLFRGKAWSWRSSELANLFGLRGTGAGAAFIGTSGQHELRIEFNPTFRGYMHAQRSSARRWSISGQRRPDIVVTYRADDHVAWLAFDAKYRAGHTNLADAFTSVHIYRDALRDNAFGGAPRGVWLLAPRRTECAKAWFGERFWAEHGCGAVELTPGALGEDALAAALGWLAGGM